MDRCHDFDIPVTNDVDFSWENDLERAPKGKVLPTQANCSRILRNHPYTQFFFFNEFTGRVSIKPDSHAPWDSEKKHRPSHAWQDHDSNCLRDFLSRYYCDFRSDVFHAALDVVAHERGYNPLTEWFDSLVWDGTPRVDRLLIDHLFADDDPVGYTRKATAVTLIGAVKRTYEPGCQFETILTLEGAQGIGKSTFFRQLAGNEYFTDSLSFDTFKDTQRLVEATEGHLICEIPEMSGKADTAIIKHMASVCTDEQRMAYGHDRYVCPRSFIFVTSVNDSGMGFLSDTTGNRRFLVVRCHKTNQSATVISPVIREQIWAVAVHRYKAGEKPFLEKKEHLDAQQAAARGALIHDDNIAGIREFLSVLLPGDWYNHRIPEHILYFDATASERAKGVRKSQDIGVYETYFLSRDFNPRTIVCVREIFCEYFRCDRYDESKYKQLAPMIRNTLISLGWTKGEKDHERFGPDYGPQCYFVSPEHKAEQGIRHH